MSSSKVSAWKYKNFRMFTYCGLLLPFAVQTQSLIIGWQIYEIKHDPLYLGFIGLAEALPALSFSLFAGYIVDRKNPLHVFIGVVLLHFLTAIILLLATLPASPLHSSSENLVYWLYSAAFLSGLARGFRMPTRVALVPILVPREVIPISSAWSASAFSIASAAGPALGGFLYAFQGAILPYTLNVIMIFFALIFTFCISIDYTPHTAKVTTKAFHEITLGLRYVFSHALLLPALTLDMFAVLFGGAVAMLPVFAADILQVGPSGLGILRASVSLGALIGSLVLIRFPVHRHSGKILLGAVAGFGFCMIGFGLSKLFWLSAFLLLMGGIFDSISMVIRGSIVQLSAPPEMRGRVGAVNSAFINVSNQLGEFESGVAAKVFGTSLSVVLGGMVTLLVVALISFRSSTLRKMEIINL